MEQVTEVLDDAVAAEIVEQVTAAFGRFRFSHTLIRETLYEDLSSVRRQLLHRSIGETLEKLCAGDLERHLAELAHHFCQAAPAGVAEKAVDYAIRAGRRAMHLLAYEEAIDDLRAGAAGARSRGRASRGHALRAAPRSRDRPGRGGRPNEVARRVPAGSRCRARGGQCARSSPRLRWGSAGRARSTTPSKRLGSRTISSFDCSRRRSPRSRSRTALFAQGC